MGEMELVALREKRVFGFNEPVLLRVVIGCMDFVGGRCGGEFGIVVVVGEGERCDAGDEDIT